MLCSWIVSRLVHHPLAEKSSSSDTLTFRSPPSVWAPLALPTLQALEPALRIGAVLFIDNSVSGADRYADLLAYLADQQNGWQMVNLPYSRGFGFAVKFGGKAGKS